MEAGECSDGDTNHYNRHGKLLESTDSICSASNLTALHAPGGGRSLSSNDSRSLSYHQQQLAPPRQSCVPINRQQHQYLPWTSESYYHTTQQQNGGSHPTAIAADYRSQHLMVGGRNSMRQTDPHHRVASSNNSFSVRLPFPSQPSSRAELPTSRRKFRRDSYNSNESSFAVAPTVASSVTNKTTAFYDDGRPQPPSPLHQHHMRHITPPSSLLASSTQDHRTPDHHHLRYNSYYTQQHYSTPPPPSLPPLMNNASLTNNAPSQMVMLHHNNQHRLATPTGNTASSNTHTLDGIVDVYPYGSHLNMNKDHNQEILQQCWRDCEQPSQPQLLLSAQQQSLPSPSLASSFRPPRTSVPSELLLDSCQQSPKPKSSKVPPPWSTPKTATTETSNWRTD